MRRIVGRTLAAMGYEVHRRRQGVDMRPLASERWTDLSRLVDRTASIPGMTTDESCKMLYALCYQQPLDGDVAEIGSWQGKSTAFLGQAVKDSGNGTMHAVDHFKGNVDKESHYVVGAPDLSDLEAGFRANMARLALDDTVVLHNEPSVHAAKHLKNTSLRFLFIDGDHSYGGVRGDLEAYWPKLRPGAIVVFDDYTKKFPGVVQAVSELIAGLKAQRAFAYWNTFVVTLPDDRVPRLPPFP